MNDSSYEHKLAQEGALWGDEAERQARVVPPDWHAHRQLRHNVVMHTADIDALLDRVQPGMRALELGCASGWLTLALAQKGAHALGLDISEKSLNVARSYYESIRQAVPGSVEYQVADLNRLELPANTYDLVVVKGTLHHLMAMAHVLDEIHKALKPGGLLWISDQLGEEAPASVLLASACMFVLPTHVSYRDKIGGLLRFGVSAPSRIKASMEAEGLSPFEGEGRDHDWVKLTAERFTIERRIDAPAFTGYITAQLNAPDSVALPLLKGLRAVDLLLVRLGLLRSTGVILFARRTT